jgi:hypothetical protein
MTEVIPGAFAGDDRPARALVLSSSGVDNISGRNAEAARQKRLVYFFTA